MELREGYRITELGAIPNDWTVDTIKNIASIRTGSRNTQDRVDGGDYPFFVRSQNVERINTYSYDGEAILTAGDGVGVGKVVHYINGKFDCHQRVYRITDFNAHVNGYYFYLYFKNNFLNRIMQMTAKSSVDSVRMDMIADMLIPIPSEKKEQTAIATALSDMDALIAQTEKLIAKKKAIKQGVMQRLLSPVDAEGKRKKGWIMKPFTDIVEYIHGKAHEQHIVHDGKYIVVNSKFISTNGEVIKYSDHSFLTAKRNDILTVLSDLPNGKALGKCFLVDKDNTYAVNQRICVWRSKGSNPVFLFYLLNRHKYFLQLDDGVTQTHILNGDIERFELDFLEDVKEQEAIGIVLSDLDKEIDSMAKCLTKLVAQKQGMMQSLLTGKIRIHQPTHEPATSI